MLMSAVVYIPQEKCVTLAQESELNILYVCGLQYTGQEALRASWDAQV